MVNMMVVLPVQLDDLKRSFPTLTFYELALLSFVTTPENLGTMTHCGSELYLGTLVLSKV